MFHAVGPERVPPGLRPVLRWERTLAQGSGGSVELCHHLHLRVGVVLKWAVTARGASADLNVRFRREARALIQLSHPGIVKLLDSGEHDGLRYLVFEYVEGPLLADLVRERGALPWREALAILLQMAEGLGEAHRHGVLHRDVKPLNTVMHESRGPVLIDFGLVRTERDATALTAENAPLGTPAYVCPEIALAGEVGPPADVYSLGIVLHELLTGSVPFVRPSLLETLEAHISEVPPEVPGIPPSLDGLLKACLAKKPEHRPRDGNAVAERVRALLEDPAAPRDSERITVPAGLPVMGRRAVARPGRAWAALVLALALLAGAIVGSKLRDGGHAATAPVEAPSPGRLVEEIDELAGRAEYEGLARDLYFGRPVGEGGRRYLADVVAWMRERAATTTRLLESPATPIDQRWKLFAALSPLEGLERSIPANSDLPRPEVGAMRGAFIVTRVTNYRPEDRFTDREILLQRYEAHKNMLVLPGLQERDLEREMEGLTGDAKDVVQSLACELTWSSGRRARRLRIYARCQGPGGALELTFAKDRVVHVWGRGRAVDMGRIGDISRWISGGAPMLESQIVEVALPPEALEPGSYVMEIAARGLARAVPGKVDCVPSVDWVVIDR